MRPSMRSPMRPPMRHPDRRPGAVAGVLVALLAAGVSCGGDSGGSGISITLVPQLSAPLEEGSVLRIRLLELSGSQVALRERPLDPDADSYRFQGLPEGEDLVLVLDAVSPDGPVVLQHRAAGITLGPSLDLGVVPLALGEMVFVPEGTFSMGSDDGPFDERPVHAVTVSAFFVDRFEVTNRILRRYVDQAGAPSPSFLDLPGLDADDQPAVGVDWTTAGLVCGFLGKRLPTEAQWERAARGITGSTFPWGDEDPRLRARQLRGLLGRDRPRGIAPRRRLGHRGRGPGRERGRVGGGLLRHRLLRGVPGGRSHGAPGRLPPGPPRRIPSRRPRRPRVDPSARPGRGHRRRRDRLPLRRLTRDVPVRITADDLGLSEEVDRGIEAAARAGALDAVSALATGPSLEHGLELLRRTGVAVGLHLDLSDGRAAADPARIPGLAEPGGSFRRSARRLALDLALGRVPVEEIEVELRAQIDLLEGSGATIAHLDGHRHAHLFPGLGSAIRRVVDERGLGYVRLVPRRGPLPVRSRARPERLTLARLSARLRATLAGSGVTLPDALGGLAEGVELDEERVLLAVERALSRPGLTEIVTHPGQPGSPPVGRARPRDRDPVLRALQSDRLRSLRSRPPPDRTPGAAPGRPA